ncbi:alginate lyase family protein [Haladaptatus sp. YSMS36]|uniref:alginate lyase family protein n=1 Tax=Haladaptatus sp. YSMS36 TaxID=3033384 RepID=UPI0023E7802F|nr:alginate lyase family protein [Haladaptatus sp. YSMS36]
MLRTALGAGALALAGCDTPPTEPSTVPDPSPQPPTDDETPTQTPSPTTPAPDVNRVLYAGLLDSVELAAIKEKVTARADPWYAGFLALKRDADRALDVAPRSVVENGAPPGVDARQFATSGADRGDYLLAMTTSHAIRDLGLAYAFTEDDRYAEQAVALLDHWCLNSRTGMVPSGRNNGEAYFSIELHITIPAMIYGASFVSGHPAWEAVDGGEATFREWVRAYLDDMNAGRGLDRYTGVIRNNIYAWWILARAVAAAYLGDQNTLRIAFRDWREYAVEQLQANGILEYERQRDDGLSYSLYGLKALALTAELARHYDEDLYEFRTKGGTESALKQAFAFYARFVASSDGWAWGLGEDGYTDTEREEGASVYELAYSQWADDAYLDAIESVGRPVNDRRILGWTTLTHANRFAL